MNLVINETEATFMFKTALTAEPTGVWKIAGITFDADAYAKVDKINKATTELAFYNALTAAGIANLKVENSPAYFAADKPAEGFKTLAEVQAFVDKVNADQTTDADQVEKVKALVKVLTPDNPSQVQVLAALEPWARVNADFIAAYVTELKTTNAITDATAFKKVQEQLDDVNVAEVSKLVNVGATSAVQTAKRADYNKAVAAMSFVRADDPENSSDKVKANLQADLDLLNLVLNVKEASTAAQFANAYNALVVKVNNKATIGTEVFYTDLRTKYMDATKAQAVGTVETVKTAKDIEDAIAAVNTVKRAELYNVVAAISNTPGSETKPADVLKALQALAAYVPNKADFDITTVATTEDRLKAYRAAFVATAALSPIADGDLDDASVVASAIAAVKAKIDSVNGTAVGTPLSAIENFDKDAVDGEGDPLYATPADAAAALVEALKHKELGLGNVVDANAELYLANQAAFNSEAASKGGSDTPAKQIKRVKDLVEELNQVANINNAKTATEVHNALMALALPDYLNVTSADRLAVAESVLELVQDSDFVAYENKDEVADAVETITDARDTALGKVNALSATSSINTVTEALASVGYKAFDDLSAGDQALVAEKFADALVFIEDGTALKSPYKSLTAIKADIDKAIAAQ